MMKLKRNLVAITLGLSIGQGAMAKTLVNCFLGSPAGLNPQIVIDGAMLMITYNMFETLTAFEEGGTRIVPGVAESWTVSKDGLTYTFKLRKNVAFHSTSYFTPTRTMNADDVLFSFNRQRLKDHSYHGVGKSGYEYFNSMEMGSLIKDIVKVDNQTVKFVLNRPEAPFLADLAMDFAGIQSAEYGDSLMKKGTPEKIDHEPIGTGPFAYVRYDKDQTLRLKRHDGFWKGKPPLDELIFSIVPDASVRFQKLKTGECQFLTEPAPADIAAMKASADMKVLEMVGLSVGYLAFNVEKMPLDNVLVRQAIYHALDRESYIQAIYLGQAVVAKNPLPLSDWSYDKEIKDLDYNPQKAKALLKKAGFPNGFTIEMYTLPVSRPYNPNGKKMGEMMQADLAKVGIKVNLVTFDWPTYLKKSSAGEHQILQLGWYSDNGDPDIFLGYLFGCGSIKNGGNRTRWCDPAYDKITKKAKVTSNVAERAKLYKEAQTILKAQVPAVPLAHATFYRAMAKNVVGFKLSPMGKDYFGNTDLK